MKLAVSNIAWSQEEEPVVAEALQELGVQYIEIAPTKQWGDPTKAPEAEVEAYKKWWSGYGIEVVAFQSMLFNRPDLKLFDTEKNRAQSLAYLQDFIVMAGRMGVQAMVFGSPKNRQKGNLKEGEAESIAKEFFAAIGNTACQNNLNFCLEPNATQYACDFITNATEGIEFVKKVNTKGFKLHLDIACMTLAGDEISKSIEEAAPLLEHFHISSPMLDAVVDRPDINHREAARALNSINYDKFVSIEMRPGSLGENVDRVREAVNFAQSIYQ